MYLSAVEQYSCSCSQGAEFNRLNKTTCESCPYSYSRESFISGGISLTNFYLYILYSIYNPKLMENRDARVLIVDECHDFDDVMSDFITIKITENMIKRFKFSDEYSIMKQLKGVTSISQYVDFLRYLNGEVLTTIESMEKGMSSAPRNVRQDKRDLKINKVIGGKNSDVKTMQLATDLRQLQLKIEIFLKEYKDNPNNWVLETYYNEKLKQKELSLEPIWAYDYLDKYVFANYDMVILRNNGFPTYNFCSILDDYDYDVTNIIRGVDHIANQSKQQVIWNLICKVDGDKPFPTITHAGLLFEGAKKLSKRSGNGTTDDYKDISTAAILNWLIKFGWSHPDPLFDKKYPTLSMQQMIDLFNDGNISDRNCKIDKAKLAFLDKRWKAIDRRTSGKNPLI
jgi:hypothetical protein